MSTEREESLQEKIAVAKAFPDDTWLETDDEYNVIGSLNWKDARPRGPHWWRVKQLVDQLEHELFLETVFGNLTKYGLIWTAKLFGQSSRQKGNDSDHNR